MRSRALTSIPNFIFAKMEPDGLKVTSREVIFSFFQNLYWFRQRSEGEGADGTFGLHS